MSDATLLEAWLQLHEQASRIPCPGRVRLEDFSGRNFEPTGITFVTDEAFLTSTRVLGLLCLTIISGHPFL